MPPGRTYDSPANALKRREDPLGLWSRASGSGSDGELQNIGGGAHLSVLDLFGDYAER
jgi:hypothetical protein